MMGRPENVAEELPLSASGGAAAPPLSAGRQHAKKWRWIALTSGLLALVALLVVVLLPLLLRDVPSSVPEELSATTITISISPTPAATSALPSRDESSTTPQRPFPTFSTDPLSLSNPSLPPSLVVAANAAAPPPRSSIVLAVLPDSQYSSEGSPYVFEAQTEWLRDHRDALGGPLVIHVGDLVQSPDSVAQWESAATAMDLMAGGGGGMDHIIVSSGNHDIRRDRLDDSQRGGGGGGGGDDDDDDDDSAEPYLEYFGPASDRVATGRDATGWSEYHQARVQGVELLVLAMDWRASNGTMEWAREVLRGHPHTPAVLVSHEFLMPTAREASDSGTGDDDGTGGVVRTDYGDYMWRELVKEEDQIFLVLCGHIDGSGWRMDSNAAGGPVLQILVNYQEHAAGGNGYTRLMELDFARDSVRQFTFSPWVQKLWRDKGARSLAPHDVAVLTDAGSSFEVSMDLARRFGDMGSVVPPELTRRPGVPWLDAVRSELGEVPPPDTSRVLPADVHDYPELSGTVAHWRFDDIAGWSEAGRPVPADALVSDLSGHENHLRRHDTEGGLPEHLVVSDGHHPLSSSRVSLCFVNPDRTDGGYLATIDTAPLNDETFVESGYTIEAFVKLPPTFLHESRPYRWTGVVARAGRIYDKFDDNSETHRGDVNEPLAVLGVSNRAEMQFASWPMERDGERRKVVITAWSSPLALDTWYHVAAVNDGNQTRLYVDGWPARRDPVYETGVAGLASAGRGWMIGASFYAERAKVFGGCLGEVRITAQALAADEFLLSRREEE